jgi:pimeloyl-ACP methyl ester carboxylesterase
MWRHVEKRRNKGHEETSRIAMSDSGSGPKLRPPSGAMMLAEARSLFELNASLWLTPVLLTAPRGDGHPVLALPGFLATDFSTSLLRRYLKMIGYAPHSWDLGRNFGGVYRMRQQLRERLADIFNQTGRKVSLIGWSLGGVYARDLALHAPEMTRSVTTLGSPFANDVSASSIRKLYEKLSGELISDAKIEDIEALAGDLAVPATSIFTKGDGIVHWRTCLLKENARSENVEIVLASHTGLGVNAAALWTIADRLAQPEGTFKPFNRMGPFMVAYGRPESGKN